jgi:hypothetical protein
MPPPPGGELATSPIVRKAFADQTAAAHHAKVATNRRSQSAGRLRWATILYKSRTTARDGKTPTTTAMTTKTSDANNDLIIAVHW